MSTRRTSRWPAQAKNSVPPRAPVILSTKRRRSHVRFRFIAASLTILALVLSPTTSLPAQNRRDPPEPKPTPRWPDGTPRFSAAAGEKGLWHPIGRWEGDTLVVDTIGFNEKFWMERQGSPHTDKLHLIERFTRTDGNNMKIELTIDDPGACTRTWTTGFFLRWGANEEFAEYIC